MRKLFLILVISGILFSCSRNYMEYSVKNNTSNQITVEIVTNGDNYMKDLTYEINPNQVIQIFEHPNEADAQNKSQLSDYMESIKIFKSGAPERIVLKKFIIENMILESNEGLFGHYDNYLFEINETDFE
jgi:hypothetical protein